MKCTSLYHNHFEFLFHTCIELLLLGCFVWVFFCYFSSPATPNSKNRVWLRTPDLLLTLYAVRELSAWDACVQCSFPATSPSTAARAYGITSPSYTQLSETSIPATNQRQYLQSCNFAGDIHRVLPSPGIIPSLHTALNCLKAVRFWLLHCSISEVRDSRYLGSACSYNVPELVCLVTYFCLWIPQARNMQNSSLKCISYGTRTSTVTGCHIINEVILQWWWGLNWHVCTQCFISGMLVSRYCEF